MKKNSIEYIVKACQKYDSKAQKMLYKMYVDRLYYIVLRYTNDKYYIENILQDVFLKIFNNIHKYDKKKASFYTWIKIIAIRESINHVKKNKLDFSPLTIVENVEINVNEILSKLNVEDLLKIVSTIPNKYRIIFNMYEIDGFSHKEISRSLSISEGTSRSYLTRGKRLIQKEYFRIHSNNIYRNG